MKFGVQTPIFVTEGKWGHIRKKTKFHKFQYGGRGAITKMV